MQGTEFRDIVSTHPFRPFRLHLGSGRSLEVHHRDFLLISPSARTIYVYTSVSPDRVQMVDVEAVESVEFIQGKDSNGTGSIRA